MSARFQRVFCLLLPCLAACGPVEDTHPGQPVAHRQAAFKQILKSFEPMGVQLRTQAYDPERFAELANALAAAKDGPWTYFGPDTCYPPSKAKPVLCEEAETFATKREAFRKAVDRLAAVAPGKNEDAVRAAYQAVQDSCRDCHKRYKE